MGDAFVGSIFGIIAIVCNARCNIARIQTLHGFTVNTWVASTPVMATVAATSTRQHDDHLPRRLGA